MRGKALRIARSAPLANTDDTHLLTDCRFVFTVSTQTKNQKVKCQFLAIGLAMLSLWRRVLCRAVCDRGIIVV